MQKEQTTLIVSVNTEQDEPAQIKQIQAQVGNGWKVIQKIPISGGGAGPGGNSEHFMRMQVTLERQIDEDNVIVEPEADDSANGDQR